MVSLSLFYLIVIISNAFWGKAITAVIFLNYVSSFDELISILPIESWIFYGCILLIIVLITVTFLYARPKPNALHRNYSWLIENKRLLRKIALAAIIFLIVTAFSYRQILSAKRALHFSGEPLLEFFLGQMWDSESMEYVYDKNRIRNAIRDRACIDSVAEERSNNPDRIVVVILLDALRKDFLSIYGYHRQTTPFLDSLSKVKKLLHVENSFSTSTTTLLGVAGLFGSKDWDNFSYAGLNLMKYLKKKNFSTYAFLTGQHRSWYGLASIYKNDCDHFYESTTNPTRQNYDDLATLKKFKETKIGTNSFIYFHLLSTHNIGKKNRQFKKFIPDKIGIGTDKRTALVNNYDNGILQADFVIRGIFKKLEEDGLLGKTSIYIVADHGELFGEEGRWSHSGSIQQDVLSVPLLIYDQDLPWYKNLETATIKDVAPTIADRLKFRVPACWEGRSLGHPVQNFSMKVNSGMSSEYPSGILSRQDSIIRLDIMDVNNQIRRTAIKQTNGTDWKVQSNSQ
jgi:glucan phosphoethanolaminetransferase (alkaline phosphatase superfamily)